MSAYSISSVSQLRVTAFSKVHNTEAVFSRLSGEISVDPETLAQNLASSAITVEMAAFDAGDFLKNRKLKADMDVDRYPKALFSLEKLEKVKPAGEALFHAEVHGTIDWRGHKVPVVAQGQCRFLADKLEASGEFRLDVTKFGIKPPKFLMVKVEDVVAVKVTLSATRKV